MSLPVETTTGFIAIVTRTMESQPFTVPGMETYFAASPVVVYQSAKLLLEKLFRSSSIQMPNLIVIDLSQATDAGLNMIRELKAHERLRSIPVLVRKITTKSTLQRALVPIRTGRLQGSSRRNEELLEIAL